eukprot:NODE_1878_length_1269_cov_60.058197_g1555_i0.p1 GENE.NODE_1878_length_1269_cov_60.058197_g1555_i0~~NODE_1878_length_1269_cov_60.058197_g1555_i0.p1  ORF type:complete len:337 (+),score=67.46 NODE_1878_length_1269_cov_60.058197_g1555_i0:164-1174(+)
MKKSFDTLWTIQVGDYVRSVPVRRQDVRRSLRAKSPSGRRVAGRGRGDRAANPGESSPAWYSVGSGPPAAVDERRKPEPEVDLSSPEALWEYLDPTGVVSAIGSSREEEALQRQEVIGRVTQVQPAQNQAQVCIWKKNGNLVMDKRPVIWLPTDTLQKRTPTEFEKEARAEYLVNSKLVTLNTCAPVSLVFYTNKLVEDILAKSDSSSKRKGRRRGEGGDGADDLHALLTIRSELRQLVSDGLITGVTLPKNTARAELQKDPVARLLKDLRQEDASRATKAAAEAAAATRAEGDKTALPTPGQAGAPFARSRSPGTPSTPSRLPALQPARTSSSNW